MTTKPTITDLETAAKNGRAEYDRAKALLDGAQSNLDGLRRARWAGQADATDETVELSRLEVARLTTDIDRASERWSTAERALSDAKAGRTK